MRHLRQAASVNMLRIIKSDNTTVRYMTAHNKNQQH